MRLLTPELMIIRKMINKYAGDVCKGMWCHWQSIPFRDLSYGHKIHTRVLHVYAKLYKFNISSIKDYSIYASITKKRFLVDMYILVHVYYNKLPENLLLLIFEEVFHRYIRGDGCSCKYRHEDTCLYVRLAKAILDKGFNVNSRMDHYRSAQTPLLLHAIYHADIVMIDVLLDKHPNVYLINSIGDSAVSALDINFRIYIESPGVYKNTKYTYDVLCKFDKLVSIQRTNH